MVQHVLVQYDDAGVPQRLGVDPGVVLDVVANVIDGQVERLATRLPRVHGANRQIEP